MNRRAFVIACAICLVAAAAEAGPLTIVHVSAPAFNTVFDTSGTIVVQDSVSTFAVAGGAGDARLQSRTTFGQPGAPAAGKYMYAYRLNLKNVMGIVNIPCMSSLTLNFSPLTSTLDYDADGVIGDQVFVVTGGGIGTVAPTSAVKTGSSITFGFSSLVCAGGSPGTGESTYLFGLTSPHGPKFVTATVKDSGGPMYTAQARAPKPFILQPADWLGWLQGLGPTGDSATRAKLHIAMTEQRRFGGTMTIEDPLLDRGSTFAVEGTMGADGGFTMTGHGPDGRLVAHGQESPMGEVAILDARVQLSFGDGKVLDGTLRLVQSVGAIEPPQAIREWVDRYAARPQPAPHLRAHRLPLPLQLHERGVQALGGQSVQEQPVARVERRQRDQRMLVVDEAEVRRVADQLRAVEGDGLVELEGVAGAPEVAVGEEQLIHRV